MHIKHYVLFAVGSFLFFWWLLCFTMVAPGYVGIIVNLFGDDKGPSHRELNVGMHWIAPWKKVYRFPMFQQNQIWDEAHGYDSFIFQTAEGLNVTADIGLSYHLKEGMVHTLFAKYRRGINEITDVFIRNYARDAINKAASKMKVEDLYGVDKQEFIESVQTQLKTDLDPMGIAIDRVYLIGTLHFPEKVVAALNSKIEATQRAQQRENELREAKAQAEKEIAKAHGEAQSILLRAEAEANANMLLAQSITQEIIFYEVIRRWDGSLPKVIGSSNPIIDMREVLKP